MILVDSNVPMYLVGAAHSRKADALSLLERLVGERQRLVTDVEVLQEILHRYLAIRRPDAIQPAFDALLSVVDDVIAVELADAEKAKDIALGGYGLSARDALHLAVMQRRGIRSILSFDAGFDAFPGIERIR